ncbi:snare-associated protein snapin [Anaeramoeba flamelloides]|uniref:Snare-associated protein snapin n=1 Tax=Anaeramoeba flamelloides TaxID=1746091 RepID=A0AAV7Z6M9_9EUKA|nr:snare-associated protein snapin [Anaeramoeba flamelloides]
MLDPIDFETGLKDLFIPIIQVATQKVQDVYQTQDSLFQRIEQLYLNLEKIQMINSAGTDELQMYSKRLREIRVRLYKITKKLIGTNERLDNIYQTIIGPQEKNEETEEPFYLQLKKKHKERHQKRKEKKMKEKKKEKTNTGLSIHF